MLRVAVEGVHYAAPVLVYLGCHALVIVPDTIARFYAMARVRAHLRGGIRERGTRPVFLVLLSLAFLDFWRRPVSLQSM